MSSCGLPNMLLLPASCITAPTMTNCCCGLQFVYDPKTKTLQFKTQSGALSGACLTDIGSWSSGKNTPGQLAVTICSRTVIPSQQWTMVPAKAQPGSAPGNYLRSATGLCIGLDKTGDIATVKCGDKSELRFSKST